jgi:hypothetical protein
MLSIALVMGAGVSLIGWIEYSSELMRLTAQVVTGVVSYGTLCRVHRIESYQAMENLVVSRLGKFLRVPLV